MPLMVVQKRQLQLKNEGKPVSKEPLVLFVAKTGVNNFMLNKEKYLAATLLVKVSFYMP